MSGREEGRCRWRWRRWWSVGRWWVVNCLPSPQQPCACYADGNMSLGSKLSITDWRPIHSRGSCGIVCPVAGMPSLAAIHAHGSCVFLVAVIAALLLHLDLWQSLVWSTLVYTYGHGSNRLERLPSPRQHPIPSSDSSRPRLSLSAAAPHRYIPVVLAFLALSFM